VLKKFFPVVVILAGLAFVVGGFYAYNRGDDAEQEVRDELVAQNIVTPEDASIPNEQVDDPETARSMADIIDTHQRESSGGLVYAEMGRFALADDPEDPAGTNNEDEALVGDNGKPVPNPARNTALTASNLRTSLFSSIMAFNVAELVKGIGIFISVSGILIAGIGVALAGMAFPGFGHRLHVDDTVSRAD
jgi:hypothetical protein